MYNFVALEGLCCSHAITPLGEFGNRHLNLASKIALQWKKRERRSTRNNGSIFAKNETHERQRKTWSDQRRSFILHFRATINEHLIKMLCPRAINFVNMAVTFLQNSAFVSSRWPNLTHAKILLSFRKMPIILYIC